MSLLDRLGRLADRLYPPPPPPPPPPPRFEPGRAQRPGPRRARGVVDRRNPRLRVIVVRLDDASFARLAAAAAASGVTVSEAVRQSLLRALDAKPPLQFGGNEFPGRAAPGQRSAAFAPAAPACAAAPAAAPAGANGGSRA